MGKRVFCSFKVVEKALRHDLSKNFHFLTFLPNFFHKSVPFFINDSLINESVNNFVVAIVNIFEG